MVKSLLRQYRDLLFEAMHEGANALDGELERTWVDIEQQIALSDRQPGAQVG